LSSAILYLAIVVIWAIVLVPRWLRRPQASETLESNLAEPVAASSLEDPAEAEVDADVGENVPAPRARAAGGGRAGSSAAERRERVLQARRRMLVTLTAITAGAGVIALTHLAAPWVVAPPAVMLAGFLLLLREAARSDTERAWAAAWRDSRTTGAGDAAADAPERKQADPADGAQAGAVEVQVGVPSPQTRVPGAPAAVPSAQIIDISGRIGDQLYDQYADAEVRAVGD
jgi:hypothetical protein